MTLRNLIAGSDIATRRRFLGGLAKSALGVSTAAALGSNALASAMNGSAGVFGWRDRQSFQVDFSPRGSSRRSVPSRSPPIESDVMIDHQLSVSRSRMMREAFMSAPEASKLRVLSPYVRP